MAKKKKENNPAIEIIKEIENQIKSGFNIKNFDKKVHELLTDFLREEIK